MKCKIYRVYKGKLDDYKEILDKYNAEYYLDEYNRNHALIKIEFVYDLIQLTKELEQEIIINSDDGSLMIYDDYLE